MNRILPASLAALVATAGIASADSYFGYIPRLDNASTLELGTVVSDVDGTVEIYRISGGELAQLIGTDTIRAGANRNVRVNLNSLPRRDVVALLRSGDEVLAEQRIEIDHGAR